MCNSKFYELIEILREKEKVIITTHDLADLDGFVSCFALKHFLNNFYKKSEITVYISSISKSTEDFIIKFKGIFKEFSFEYEKFVNLTNFDILLILDTNNLSQVSFNGYHNLDDLKIPYIFIDHHFNLKKKYKGNISSLNIILDDYPSTSEIIYEFFKFYNIDIDKIHKNLIIAGILIDTGFLKYANNNTFNKITSFLDGSINYQQILQMLSHKKDISEKIAKIKGLQRVKIIRVGEWIIGLTNVSNFEASVASSLLNIGFDIGLVVSNKTTHYRISSRAEGKVCMEKDLHLGRLFGGIAEDLNGSGGGHDGAASLNIKENPELIINKIILKLKDILNS